MGPISEPKGGRRSGFGQDIDLIRAGGWLPAGVRQDKACIRADGFFQFAATTQARRWCIQHYLRGRRRRRLFETTRTELQAMAAAATIGLSTKPRAPDSTPVATGMAMRL